MIKKVCAEHKYIFCFLLGILNSLPFIWEDLFWISWFSFSPFFIFLIFFDMFVANKKQLYICILLFCFAYYFGAYNFFVALYPMTFVGIGYVGSIFILSFAWLLLSVLHGLFMSFGIFLVTCLNKRSTFRILSVALVFVIIEYAQSVGPIGFPWARFSLPQYRNLYAIQSSSLFGPYFVDFIMMIINAFLAFIVTKKKIKYVVALVAVFLANYLFGFFWSSFDFDTKGDMKVAIVQGNVLSNEKWHGKSSFRTYMELSAKVDSSVDMIVWGESAIPTELNTSKLIMNEISRLAYDKNTEFLVGAFYNDGYGNVYNGAFNVTGEGMSETVYFKRRLVPFGEYLPMRRLLNAVPFLDSINMLSYDLSAGKHVNVIDTKNGKIGCLICFDSIFHNLAKTSVNEGSELLAILTNDSWYKDFPAVYQHNAQAVWRAVENGRWVVRSANSGISSVISPKGKIVSSLPPLVQGVLQEKVYFIEQNTVYSLIGDVIILPMLFVLVLILILGNKKAFVKQKLN